jgi:hypothetical protein
MSGHCHYYNPPFEVIGLLREEQSQRSSLLYSYLVFNPQEIQIGMANNQVYISIYSFTRTMTAETFPISITPSKNS